MRALLPIGIFICLFLHFKNKPETDTHDSLSTQMSSIKRPEIKGTTARINDTAIEPELETNSETPSFSNTEPDEDLDEELAQNEDEEFNVPWGEIEEGWRSELKDYLTKVDPEHAEEMFNAYMSEKSLMDRAPADLADVDGVTSEAKSDGTGEYADQSTLESRHEDRLKEIFGSHFKQIQALHKDYVESVQYLNRSEIKFSIAL